MRINTQANNIDYNFIGWKSYNIIKKKAMEQKFSWSGLLLSLSIAFFVVIISAQALNFFYNSVQSAQRHEYFLKQKVYYLEAGEHINQSAQDNLHKLKICVTRHV